MTTPDRPNVVLILTDQQQAGLMSCAGNRHVRTPAMDALAAGGVRFQRAYCTNPVCSPSRFSLMTGRMPSEIRLLSDNTAAGVSPAALIANHGLGRLLRDAGYRTAYGGKVHFPGMTPEGAAFETLCSDERDELAAACARFLRERRREPFFLIASFINPHDICYLAIRDSQQGEGERHLVAQSGEALRTLDAALRRPAGVSEEAFFAAHCPPLPDNFEPQQLEPEIIPLLLEARPFRMKARREWTERRWREHRWAYARLTEVVDAQIGTVLKALDESGQAGNTLVILSSDHGDMDAAHRMEHKSTLYEEACRIPLIIRPPGDPSTGCVDGDHLVSNGLDVLPTICDYASVRMPEHLTGRSLRPILEGRPCADWRQSLAIESVIGRMIVTRRFKYSVYDLSENGEHLIDLDADPGEMTNALSRPEHRRVVESLRAEFRRAFGDQPRRQEDILKSLAGG